MLLEVGFAVPPLLVQVAESLGVVVCSIPRTTAVEVGPPPIGVDVGAAPPVSEPLSGVMVADLSLVAVSLASAVASINPPIPIIRTTAKLPINHGSNGFGRLRLPQ